MIVVLFDILNIYPFMEMLMTKMFSFNSCYFKGKGEQAAQQPRTLVALWLEDHSGRRSLLSELL